MPTPSPDGRIKFKQTVQLKSLVAIITAEAFGGPIITLQGQMFSQANLPLGGIGGPGEDPPKNSSSGVARWLLDVHPDTHYIKWGVRAFRSAGDGIYTVTGKIFDLDGTELAVGRFGGQIPDKAGNDVLVFDGVFVLLPSGGLPAAVPAGQNV